MRGVFKGSVFLFLLSFSLAVLHSCSLDNHILKPSCLIFEIDLNEKWWLPQDSAYQPLYFRSNGRLRIEGKTDTLTFLLENCNKLAITNNSMLTAEEWAIKRITENDLHLQFPDEKVVMYLRKR